MLLEGKKIAAEIENKIKNEILFLHRKPGLAVILVGHLDASLAYVKRKQKSCASVDILSFLHHLPETIAEKELLDLIESLNHDPQVDGILVQLPLPAHIDVNQVLLAIDPKKDVDGLHPFNMGKLALGQTDGFIPCTPLGIQLLLAHSHIPLDGKHAVIVGRSNLVGKPLALLLARRDVNATVTLAHSRTKALKEICLSADILIVAIGSPRFVTAEMVREGCVVIDVGIHKTAHGIVGDVDFAAVEPKCSAITPVPGGVGPMTIAALLSNTLRAYIHK